MRAFAWSLVVVCSCCVSLSTTCFAAQERAKAFVGAKIIPIEGEEIDDGTLVVDGGKIVAVGPAAEVTIPEGAEKIDVAGKVIMPGLICTHSHIGGMRTGSGAADGSGPIQPGVRIMDAIDVYDPGFKRAVAGGLTTLNIMPGSGHLISGQTIYVKLRLEDPQPRKIDDFYILDGDGKMTGGLKMANGTNSMRDPPFPGIARQKRVPGARAVHQSPRVSGQDHSRRRRPRQATAA